MLGVDYLTAVAKELCEPNASQTLLEAFPLDAEGMWAFSAGVMVFIPKNVPQEQDGRKFHAPGDARPLTVVNTDNWLVANAIRLRVQLLAAQGFGAEQRGFLTGRSLLSNVLDIDVDMRMASAVGVSPGAVFF